MAHRMTFPNLRSGCDYYALQAFQSTVAREKLQLIYLAAFVAEALASNILTGPHTFTALCGRPSSGVFTGPEVSLW